MTHLTPIALFTLMFAALVPVTTAQANGGIILENTNFPPHTVIESTTGQLVLSEAGSEGSLTLEGADDGLWLSRGGDDPVDVFLETVEDKNGQLILTWHAQDQPVVDALFDILDDVGPIELGTQESKNDPIDVFVEVVEDKQGQLIINR